MKLKLTYQRSDHHAVDVIITAEGNATVGDVAEYLLNADPQHTVAIESPTLSVAQDPAASATSLPPTQQLLDAPVLSGRSVRVVPGSHAIYRGNSASGQAAVMKVLSGPDAPKEFPLPAGTSVIGRDPSADCMLTDTLVSRRHAQVVVDSQIQVIDLNSANGLVMDGAVVTRVSMQPGQSITVGDSELTFQLLASAPDNGSAASRGGAVAYNRRPVVEARFPARELPRPAVPTEFDKPPFPWIMMIAPVVIGALAFLATHNPLSLLFVAMSPMMMTANYVMSRKRIGRQRDSAIGLFLRQLAALESVFTAEQPNEVTIRNAENPTVESVTRAAAQRESLLWTRRPEHWNFLDLRLGTGTAPSRLSVAVAEDKAEGLPEYTAQLNDLIAKYRQVDGVPIVESPTLAGALGVAGDPRDAADVARALLAQVAGLHAPTEVVIAAITGSQGAHDYEWLKWLPHISAANSPIETAHLAASTAAGTALLTQLEAVVATRLQDPNQPGPLGARPTLLEATAAGGAVGATSPDDPSQALPAIVVLITADAPIDRARLAQLAERSPSAGVYTLWVAPTPAELPAVCRTFIDATGGSQRSQVNFVRHGIVVPDVVAEVLDRDRAMTLAKQLAPVTDTAALEADSSDLPTAVPLLKILGPEIAEHPGVVVDRWRQNFAIHIRDGRPPVRRNRPATLRAMVGHLGTDAMHLDLRTQGPHALVGGTTGSGKSEFLQAWVLGMASEYSPDRVTFLFVDYKGGAAFANCVKLPHCVGLVTDLSPRLVRRALTSLKAELRYREHQFNVKGVKDILEFERSGDPACPPALVIVIDEFAALSGDVPEFVDGVVDVAQRGRSLGIHLIMATQRPAGVIRDNLRANTNLRIALRMADEADSTDVVGSPQAAALDPSVPGRGVAKTGPGRLVPFQSAYAGGWTSSTPAAPAIAVHELRFGPDIEWSVDKPEIDHGDAPTDQARLVSNISAAAAAAAIPAPRRPWLNELGRAYDLRDLGPRNDRELILGVIDRPEDQIQEKVYFRPDIDGNLAIYGTGGSGKTVVLRTLAAAAGVTPRGGPVDVYALDFAAGGLSMLEALPHVGAVVPGDDAERVQRLMRQLRETADRRAQTYPAASAGTIAEYRERTDNLREPRILLLIDGYPAFRAEYEGSAGPRGAAYTIFGQLLTEGRQLGIHIAFTADRPSSVPGAVAASVPRRVVLRLAEDTMYNLLDVPSDVLDAGSPPGRAVIDGAEAQIAILGGSGNVADQYAAITRLAAAIAKTERSMVAGIATLPTQLPQNELPVSVAGLPVLGLSDIDLAPIGFPADGAFLLGGGPSSGRSNAIAALCRAVERWDPDRQRYYLGNRRTAEGIKYRWAEAAGSVEDVAKLAERLTAAIGDAPSTRLAVFIEGLSEFSGTAAENPIVNLVKAVRRAGQLVIGESETSTWGSSFPLYSEIKSARRGILLQPDTIEGDTILRTTFPRVARAEFPPGRGLFVNAGKVVRVQLPLAE